MLMAVRPVGKVRTGKATPGRSTKGRLDRRRPIRSRIPAGTSTRREKQLIGVIVSILLHFGLLIYGTAWLIQRAQFHVERGDISTEIALTILPAPKPTPSPPPPAPTLPPPQRMKSIVTPAPILPEIVKTAEPTTSKPSPSFAKPISQSAKPVAKPTTARSTPVSSASKGATQAEPDELHNEPPEYPEESQLNHEQGVVVLRVQVTATGEPTEVSVLQSSGFFRLDQAAREAVRHWRFHPSMIAGMPVSSEADVPVRFKLENSSSY